jgi:kynurenine formamidase
MTELRTQLEEAPALRVPAEARVQAAQFVQRGDCYSLALERYRRMPTHPAHPALEVHTFRTPWGLRAAGEDPWPWPNEVGLSYMTEVITGTTHTGAHIDALAHITIGEEGSWFGGGSVDEHLSDFGPSYGDASHFRPIFARGILLDAARYKQRPCLDKGEAVTAEDVEGICSAQGVQIREWDVVLVRTGYMSLWPDMAKMTEHGGAGIDLSAAESFTAAGAIAVGGDTEALEVQPPPNPGTPANPQPVHTHLLIRSGVHIIENLYLEEIARDQVYEFLFVALPTKIRGATGSMIDPIAVV